MDCGTTGEPASKGQGSGHGWGRSTRWVATADLHHAAAQGQDQVEGRLIMDVVVRERAVILELVAVED